MQAVIRGGIVGGMANLLEVKKANGERHGISGVPLEVDYWGHVNCLAFSSIQTLLRFLQKSNLRRLFYY